MFGYQKFPFLTSTRINNAALVYQPIYGWDFTSFLNEVTSPMNPGRDSQLGYPGPLLRCKPMSITTEI